MVDKGPLLPSNRTASSWTKYLVLAGAAALGVLVVLLFHPGSHDLMSSEVCSDTCPHANNGVCDEGRLFGMATAKDGSTSAVSNALAGHSLREAAVLCDLGTDSTDCGCWLGRTQSREWDEELPPIAFIRSQTQSNGEPVSVVAQRTTTTPSFFIATTLAESDKGVSEQLKNFGLFEGGNTRVFKEVLEGRCLRPGGLGQSRRLVLDVGSNFGYFAVMAAMYGCRVVAWEPVPLFRAFLEWSAAANSVGHLVDIRPFSVGAKSGEELQIGMVLDNSLPWGQASVEGTGVLEQSAVSTKIVTISEALHDVVNVREDILMLKVDVQGWEAAVMEGAQGLVSLRSVENVLIDYAPSNVEHLATAIPRGKEMVQMLLNLLNSRYLLADVPESYSDSPVDLAKQLPYFRQITSEVLQYDMADLERGCPASEPDLSKLKNFTVWSYWLTFPCNMQKPALANPHSFRSTFFHSTNVWAKRPIPEDKLEAAIKLERQPNFQLSVPVGTLSPSEDPRSVWVSQDNTPTGVGGVDCNAVDPAHAVIHRCPCHDQTVCGQEEQAVLALLRAGKLRHAYKLGSR